MARPPLKRQWVAKNRPPPAFGSPDDLQDLLEGRLYASGLDAADARALELQALSADDVATLGLPWRARVPALSLPYVSPWPDAPSGLVRYRCLRDPSPRPKDWQKYIQPKGSPVRAYFPALAKAKWGKWVADPAVDLVLTEGEFKAAAATKAGFPTIGLGGVWNFRSRKADVALLPELERVAWEGRRVTIVYDSDSESNDEVRRARQVLANELLQRGADVRQAVPPAVAASGKTGLDDFLVAAGAEALKELLRAATKMVLDWRLFYAYGSSGPVHSVANVLVALRHAPELRDVLGYDEFARSTTVVRPLPQDLRPTPRPLDDIDVTCLQEWLQTEGGLVRVGGDHIALAVEKRAREHTFHPLRDWLDGLRWDGVDRLTGWLARAVGAPPSPYLTAVGTMFLVSMAARAYAPGCQVDHLLVLEGSEQGEGKSSLGRRLADPWFSDALPAIQQDDVRASMHLRGLWLIEVAELAAVRKADVEAVKQFLTRRVERYTPKYSRYEVQEPRTCVFYGTTNEDHYLQDETGNRRYWPVACGTIDLAWVTEVRDQLFAEAVVRYRRGDPWHADPETERTLIRFEQAQRFAGGALDDDLRVYLKRLLDTAVKKGDDLASLRVTAGKVLADVFFIPPIQQLPSMLQRVGYAFKRCGWRPVRRSAEGTTAAYAPGPPVVQALTKVTETPARRLPKKGQAADVVRLDASRPRAQKY